MNQTQEFDDVSLFEDSNEEDDQLVSSNISLQEYTVRAENSRKNKIVDFCIRASAWIIVCSVILIGIDLYAQSKNLNTELIKSCFSLITYLATAASGFLFASNSK